MDKAPLARGAFSYKKRAGKPTAVESSSSAQHFIDLSDKFKSIGVGVRPLVEADNSGSEAGSPPALAVGGSFIRAKNIQCSLHSQRCTYTHT